MPTVTLRFIICCRRFGFDSFGENVETISISNAKKSCAVCFIDGVFVTVITTVNNSKSIMMATINSILAVLRNLSTKTTIRQPPPSMVAQPLLATQSSGFFMENCSFRQASCHARLCYSCVVISTSSRKCYTTCHGEENSLCCRTTVVNLEMLQLLEELNVLYETRAYILT